MDVKTTQTFTGAAGLNVTAERDGNVVSIKSITADLTSIKTIDDLKTFAKDVTQVGRRLTPRVAQPRKKKEKAAAPAAEKK